MPLTARAVEATRCDKRGPYTLRHTFAMEALAAGVSIFELARLMGTSVRMIDRTHGHVAHDSEDAIRAKLETRSTLAPRWRQPRRSKSKLLFCRYFMSGAYRDRTGDLRLAKPALSQLS